MNLQNLKLKASTLCAGGTLLVFGGFLTVNLAGCGGGGGGGLTTIPTPSPVGATFRLVQQDSSPSRGGTLTLTGGGKTFQGTADNSGVVVLGNVTPGTYNATFSSFTSNGIALPSTSRRLVVTRTGVQNFVLVQGDTGNGAFTITGTILQNSGANGGGNFTNCGINSTPITAPLLISVRDLNDTTGAPIIAQVVRPEPDNNTPAALKGRYTISLPTNPRSFRVEVTPSDNNGVLYAGISATTTFTQGTTTLTNVDVCANKNGRIPVPFSPTATPTVTPTGRFAPVGTSTPTATATTNNPNMTPTTPRATNTPLPTSTPSATNTPSNTPSFTPVPNVATGGNTAGGGNGGSTTLGTPGQTPIGTGNNASGGNNNGGGNGGSTTLGTPGQTPVSPNGRTRR